MIANPAKKVKATQKVHIKKQPEKTANHTKIIQINTTNTIHNKNYKINKHIKTKTTA